MSMPTNSMYMGCAVLISLNTIIHINRKSFRLHKEAQRIPRQPKAISQQNDHVAYAPEKELIYRIYKELKN